MPYQVLARKWRPQRFDEVVGQQAVTRTLRNAVMSGRIAQAFVFAGPRGCGKTTTARILARALNCVKGPTPDPCGECDACVEIAQGRDLDVLEIDAASHTGVDNIREVVIAGLAITAARDRYKVFIIDEVHQLSAASFNALLKSIEEPPPHVVFMMATTELHKIPDTILSRSQVFEFKTISPKAIAEQLRRIAAAEKLEVTDDALALIARSAEGSMRDAQSALDQVTAFAAGAIRVEDVSTVLGLVGRDLLFDIVQAVIAEDGPRAFECADRAVEAGYDLRLVCRELSRVVRDILIVSIDPSRVGDGEIAESERERLLALSGRFSREDLMRAFDLLVKADEEMRNASHPRYYFEMLLMRWMHLRKLVPLADLMEQLGGASGPAGELGAAAARRPLPKPVPTPPRVAAPAPRPAAGSKGNLPDQEARPLQTEAPAAPPRSSLKDTLLAEIRRGKPTLYELAVAQARRIDVADDRITFTFPPNQNVARLQLEQNRGWIEEAVVRVANRRIPVSVTQAEGAAPPQQEVAAPGRPVVSDTPARNLKAEAMSSAAVQAMLEVFPGEIGKVEEI
jgi:DNA polymerase-3 subunit gamma/tau